MSLLTDLRFALRLWRRHPTLVVVAGLSLGLGVGATTTMYSVVSKVAHHRLGFKDVDRMVIVWSTDPERGITEQPPTWEIVQALLKDGRSFQAFGLAQFGGAPVTLAGTDQTSRGGRRVRLEPCPQRHVLADDVGRPRGLQRHRGADAGGRSDRGLGTRPARHPNRSPASVEVRVAD